jgi:hypothetical protein
MSRRDMEDLLEEARGLGFTVERASKHWRLRPPGTGEIIFCPTTPSDHRSVANTRALIKRALRFQAQAAIS